MWRPTLEMVLAGLFAVLAVVTVIWPQWIEGVTGLDPDRGDGGLEWLAVAGLAVGAVVSAALARRDLSAAAMRRHIIDETAA